MRAAARRFPTRPRSTPTRSAGVPDTEEKSRLGLPLKIAPRFSDDGPALAIFSRARRSPRQNRRNGFLIENFTDFQFGLRRFFLWKQYS